MTRTTKLQVNYYFFLKKGELWYVPPSFLVAFGENDVGERTFFDNYLSVGALGATLI